MVFEFHRYGDVLESIRALQLLLQLMLLKNAVPFKLGHAISFLIFGRVIGANQLQDSLLPTKHWYVLAAHTPIYIHLVIHTSHQHKNMHIKKMQCSTMEFYFRKEKRLKKENV